MRFYKSQLRSQSLFAMSVFKTSKGVCKGITDAVARFRLGDDENQRECIDGLIEITFSQKRWRDGFRGLHSFNLAMFAKQWWRLLDDPESLCATVLHAKYYPTQDFLSARLKKGALFTWQSIHAGIKTFKQGHIWRIRNEEKVNIWDDHWVPLIPSRKVVTPRAGVLITKVNELIDPTTKSWDEELLRDIFSPIDVNRILQIPLSNSSFGDFVAWHGTQSGHLSVKTTYDLEWKHQFQYTGISQFVPSSENPI